MNLQTITWIEVKDGDDRARALFKRHYSYHPYKDGRRPLLFAGPGEKMVLITPDCSALFIWRKFIESGSIKSKGVNCSVFRNESQLLSSDLIREADSMAWQRWQDNRHYTYVNPREVHGDGKCFKAAGWQKLKERTRVNHLIVLEIFKS